MRNKKLIILALIMGGILLLCACGKGEGEDEKADKGNGVTQIVLTTGFEKDEVFRIGSSSCYTNEFMVYLTNIQNRYEAVYGSQIWSVSSNGISMESRIKDTVAARIAQVKTMNLLADQYQVRLTDEEEKLVMQASAEYYQSLNDDEIQSMNVTEELIGQMYREYAIAHKVYEYIIRDINPEISDDEARSVTVDWIFIRSSEENAEKEELAEELKKRLDEGEDFYTLALSYSDDKTVTHSFGKGVVDSAVEECAFNLAGNETGEVIKGEEGYYIIHCVSTLDRKETDVNKEKIITRRKKEAFNEVYGTFAENQIRQLNEELWKSIFMVHEEQVTTSDFFDIYEKYFPE